MKGKVCKKPLKLGAQDCDSWVGAITKSPQLLKAELDGSLGSQEL